MSHFETLGILDEIEALVSDKLQVVSYKWLSRNFLIPSNTSKRLLQQSVERHRHEDGLQILYTLSGWSKNDPSSYHIKLASGSKLQEAKQEFDGNCSIHVYSVQACIPKDPAVLWNTEFVQAEELFNQPPDVDNCLRDNRFCGISNAFVKRHVDGTSNTAFSKLNGVRTSGPSTSNTHRDVVSPASQLKTFQQSTTDGRLASKDTKDVKGDSDRQVEDPATKPSMDKVKVTSVPDGKKTGQNDKSTSTGGNSLANLWGRASTKSKPVPAESEIPEPQVHAREKASESSDDEVQAMNFKRNNNGEVSRKRRVVFDFSDEDDEFEDAVNLASPDFPKAQSHVASKGSTKELALEERNLDTNEAKDNIKKVKQEKATDQESNKPFDEDVSIVRGGRKSSTHTSNKSQIHVAEIDLVNKDEEINPAPASPKRRKVLKTRIDERGREVTEVVWEGEETETKRADSTGTMKAHNDSSIKTTNRPPVTKKSPAVGNALQSNVASKTGNKKAAGAKDPKQGNILSFFKKV